MLYKTIKKVKSLFYKNNHNKDSININHSAAVVSILTIFCRILGFARDTVIAKYLGAGDAADSFFASFKLSNLFRKIFGEGSLFSGFVPVFTKINSQSKDEAILFSSKVFTIITILLLLIVALSEIFMDKIILLVSPGFTGKKLEIAITISKITFPYFYFITSCSVLWGVLNSIGSFFYYGFLPAVLSIVMIFFGLVLKNHFNDISICFSYAILVGGVIQLLISYLGCLTNGFKIKIVFTKHLFDKNVIQVFKKMFNTTISTSLTQINTIIDGILASFIASAVSYLYYADRIFYFPFSIVGVTLSIVSLPAISKAVANGDMQKNKALQTLAIKLVLMYGIPAAFGMFFCSKALVHTIFEYGDFTSKDANEVAIITSIFACGIFFALANRFLSVIFFANGDTKTPMKITMYGVIINIAFSLLLIKPYGVYGIAAGNSISYIFSTLAMLHYLKIKNLLILENQIKQFATKTVICSLVVGLCCFLFSNFLLSQNFGFFMRVACVCIFGIFCATVYIILMRLCKIDLLKITFSGKVC